MLGTIKEYAADRLTEAGESDLARQAHLGYFTELAESADPHLRRAEQLAWLARLEADHDNISAAMRARSRPDRRRRRCGSRRPPAGTGGSAGAGPKASS